jgi:hypothetical protein
MNLPKEQAIGLVPPTSNFNTSGLVDPRQFGNGPVNVSLGAFQPTDFVSRIRSVTQELPDVFPYNEDLHGGDQVGTADVLNFVDHRSRRSYSAPAYLTPVQNRKNLDVLVDTTITRLIASAGAVGPSDNVQITEVEVAANRDGM